MKQVNVTIDPKGNVVVETVGVIGPNCKELSRKIEESLGTAKDEQLKPEFFQQNTQGNQAQQGFGGGF